MAANLSTGSTGTDVIRLQAMCNFVAAQTGLPRGVGGTKLALLVVDGNFGAKTKARVVEFQTKAQLKADGIAGRRTTAALFGAVLGGMLAARMP